MATSDSAFVGSVPDLYDQYLGPMLFEPYAVNLAARFAGFTGDLLELAAGTGRATRALAARVSSDARITATDLNAPMLERAERVVQAPNLTWRQADAQQLPFDADSFDAVACQFGVMFFPDKPGAFREARRVLRSGGRLAFNVWCDLEANDFPRITRDLLAARFPDDPPGFFERGPFGYQDVEAIRADLVSAGFGEIGFEAVDLDTPSPSAADAAIGLCRGSPLAAEIEARHPGALNGVVEAVADTLARAFGPGPIAGKGRALVVTARA